MKQEKENFKKQVKQNFSVRTSKRHVNHSLQSSVFFTPPSTALSAIFLTW